MSANPYHPPQPVASDAALPRENSDPSLRKATLYIAATTVIAAVIGCLVGMGIGTLAPDYYRYVFRVGPDADFHPGAVGGAMGLLQGGGVGLVIGVLLVVIHYWYSLRVLRLRLKMD
jgi:hypothetical protein